MTSINGKCVTYKHTEHRRKNTDENRTSSRCRCMSADGFVVCLPEKKKIKINKYGGDRC